MSFFCINSKVDFADRFLSLASVALVSSTSAVPIHPWFSCFSTPSVSSLITAFDVVLKCIARYIGMTSTAFRTAATKSALPDCVCPGSLARKAFCSHLVKPKTANSLFLGRNPDKEWIGSRRVFSTECRNLVWCVLFDLSGGNPLSF